MHASSRPDVLSLRRHPVVVIPGDGIGPEVIAQVRRILDTALGLEGSAIDWRTCEAGGAAFRRGVASGVPGETADAIAAARVVLKGPLETPVGFGEKSANVTLRKLFETFGNIRPVRALPRVPSPYAGRVIDCVIVRENLEDVYAGIEHMHTPDVAQCLKLITRPGSKKIIRLAFELARAEGRDLVTCATKANIMKLTEGLFKRVFEEVAAEYPDVGAQHMIVDNAAHQLVMRPEQFGVLVMTNMNGDILSDLASGLVGGLGFAPSANVGHDVAMFEAVHGSAPDIAGQDRANPTALLLSGAMLLRHVGERAAADRVEAALRGALADGVHTGDIPGDSPAVGTAAFSDAIVARLERAGMSPQSVAKAVPDRALRIPPRIATVTTAAQQTVGVDVFLATDEAAAALGPVVEELVRGSTWQLAVCANRGTALYPGVAGVAADIVNSWQIRFIPREGAGPVTPGSVRELLARLEARYAWTQVIRLQAFDGAPAFSKAQGER